MEAGNEMILQVSDERRFLVAFWACILGRIIPVPLAVGSTDEHRGKLLLIRAVLNHPFLLTSSRSDPQEIDPRTIQADTDWSTFDPAIIGDTGQDDLAFIQFSSGSTGSPKGVKLTHKNLLTNIAAISSAASYTPDDRTLSWMPLTHDMGLIGFHLNPLYVGMQQLIISTAAFVRRPSLWLEKATDHAVSVLCSPNFGYKYLLKHFNPLKPIDLSRVRIVYNGAEPISRSLCDAFIAKMSAYGLDRNAMCPVYGLAEASLAVSISDPAAAVRSLRVNRHLLRIGDRISVATAENEGIDCVNVGPAVDHCAIRIADDQDTILDEEKVGHIQIAGPNVTGGYYNNGEATARGRTQDGWLRTGDIGFIKDRCLYVSGREKDILFINGKNYFSHDIERMAEEVPGIELNKIVVAGFTNGSGEEQIVTFVYWKEKLEDFLPVAAGLTEYINKHLGVFLPEVIPVKNIPRTTSGKLQRYKLVEEYRNGSFKATIDGLTALRDLQHSAEGCRHLPNDELETAILDIFRRVFGDPGIHIQDKYLDLGGNSLRAAEIAGEILRVLHIDVPVAKFYEDRSLRSLASDIREMEKVVFRELPFAAHQPAYPLSSSQKRIYYASIWDTGSVAYNLPLALRLSGKVDAARLENALTSLVKRHESLRTSFRDPADPVFVIHDTVEVAIQRAACTRENVRAVVRGLVQPFDLEHLPLFRVALVDQEDGGTILFIDLHHLIADGVSLFNFLDELWQLYAGADLPAPDHQFKDHCSWERSVLIPAETPDLIRYWKGVLGDERQMLELPVDLPRPALSNRSGARTDFGLDQQLTERLRVLCAQQGVSLHTLLFSLYAVLLNKYTFQYDLTIGIPLAGRRHPDAQRMIGAFVNNLPVRCILEDDIPFVEFLHYIRDVLQQTYSHQDVSFDSLLQLAEHSKGVRNTVFYDTMFVYQNMGMPDSAIAGVAMDRLHFDPGSAKFDLSMEIFEHSRRLEGALEYGVGLFAADTILRIKDGYLELIGQVLDRPATRLSALRVMDERRLRRLIDEGKGERRILPKDSGVHLLFREQAMKGPERVAVVFGEQQLTYRELELASNEFAAVLLGKGVKRNDIVAMVLSRSPELLIGILGILKAGAGYLPIDSGLPPDRIRFIIEDSRAVAALVEDGQVDPYGIPLIERKAIRSGTDHTAMSLPEPVDPGDLAYVIYTSGTTGKPKGVMITHHSLLNYATWAAEKYISEPSLTFGLFTSPAFDLTVTSIFPPLITGNKIVIFEAEDNAALMGKVMACDQTEILKLTPSHLRYLVGQYSRDTHNSRIKRLVVGGETLDVGLANAVLQLFGGQVEIYNEYGPTEATVGCMIHLFDAGEGYPTVPIGIPAANTGIYILDRHLQPVPEGVRGEMYISGDCLAKGYLYREGLTAERFIASPFQSGEVIYRTGDLARRLPGCILEYLGRMDQQVKINGYRVEPEEVAWQLKEHPYIAEAIVVYRNKQLIAYYVSDKRYPHRADEMALNDFLKDRLPYYMIPAVFVELSEIPLTGNGKIDLRALPEQQTGAAVRVSPGNATEEVLLNVMREVLRTEDIGIRDGFFEHGGDSIKALQVTSRLKAAGIDLKAKDVLEHQIIERIAPFATWNSATSVAGQGIVNGDKPFFPMERWFFDRQFFNPGHYGQSVLLDLHREPKVDLLRSAFDHLIRHHDGLRLNYHAKRGTLFYNPVHLEGRFMIPEYSPGKDGPSVPFYCEKLKNFDLQNDLLLRAALIRLEGHPTRLFITAHHLVVDGVSWRILLEDLVAAYDSLDAQEPVRLPLKTATVPATREPVTSAAVTVDRLFEKEDADWRVAHAAKCYGYLSREDTDYLLKGANQAYRTDVPILLNTILMATIRQWKGKDALVVEQEGHGRDDGSNDTSRTVGWLTVLYPLSLQLRGDGWEDWIMSIKEQIRAQERTIRHYRGIGGLGAVRLNYLGQFDTELRNTLFSYESGDTGPDSDRNNLMTVQLELNIMVIAGQMQIEFVYNSTVVLTADLESAVEMFVDNARLLLAHLRSRNDIRLTPSDFSADLDQKELDELFI